MPDKFELLAERLANRNRINEINQELYLSDVSPGDEQVLAFVREVRVLIRRNMELDGLILIEKDKMGDH